jgi:hypothetical protein
MKNAKQIIMLVHAAPNIHPGGVQGALFRLVYQSDGTPLPVKKPPSAKAAKFIVRNTMNLITILF